MNIKKSSNEPVDTSRNDKLERITGWLVFLVVLLFYGFKAPSFAVPGRWAGIIASFSELDPFRPLIRPIWSTLIWLVSSLPIANLGHAVNLISAVAGATVCWCLYATVRSIPFSRTFRRKQNDAVERFPRMVAGVLAALFAAASLPMIMISTRGDFAVLDILLLTLAMYFAVQYKADSRITRLYQSAIFFGLALVEYPTAAYVMPFYLLWWCYVLWKRKAVTVSQVAMAITLMASGVVILLVCANVYAFSSFAAVRGLESPLEMLRQYALLYYAELTQSVPKVGWLLILGMNVVPFVVIMFRELDEPADTFSAIGVYAFRWVLFILAVIILFGLPGSPARVLGPRVMLVAPSIIVAVWFGYLAGYFTGLLIQRDKVFLGRLFALVWLTVIAAAGIYNAQASRVGHLQPVHAFARNIFARLPDIDYLVTDGSLDPSLSLAAREAGRKVHLINYRAESSVHTGRHLANMVSDTELKSLATMGPPALLRGWFRRHPDVALRFALLVPPDLVPVPGYKAVPNGYVYTLVDEKMLPEANVLHADFEKEWPGLPVPDLSQVGYGETGWFQSQFITRWISRQANDLGVLFDRLGQLEFAEDTYRKATERWADNVSASLNLRDLSRRRDDQEDLAFANTQLTGQLKRSPQALNMNYLAMYCGTVMNPAGMLEGTMPGADPASDPLAMDPVDAQLAMAKYRLRGRDVAESQSIYEKILSAEPANLEALYGLLQVAMLQRNIPEAEHIIERMRLVGVDPQRLRIEEAMVMLTSGKSEEAKQVLLEITSESGAPPEAWFSLAQVAIRDKDEATLISALAALERERTYLPGILLLGERAVLQQDIENARMYFKRALALSPGNEMVLTRLIQLDFRERDAESLRQHVGALLAVSPDHPYGNFMAAYPHIASGNMPMAETSLRRSLSLRDNGEVRNELAWVLSQQGKLEEALTHALKAVDLTPANPNFWDSLAGIYTKSGRQPDAERAAAKMLELSNYEEPSFLIHAAEIFLAGGNPEKAGECVTRVKSLDKEISAEDKQKLNEVEVAVKR